MERRSFLTGFAGLAACQLCGSRVFAAEGVHWSYAGEAGPEHWGSLDKASAACSSGSQQSPLDIVDATQAELPELKVAWNALAGSIFNNGHTIQIDTQSGGSLAAGDASYDLLQFHFHAPSEHLVGGQKFPMEVHFVHKNSATGTLGVLGVFLKEGAGNPAFAAIVGAMPKQHAATAPIPADVDINALLPKSLAYWSYEGSLTTPPCSETVDWRVLIEPIEVAGADIAAFTALYPLNARPAQTVNRRFILRSG
jgi:carbonic anhydrase